MTKKKKSKLKNITANGTITGWNIDGQNINVNFISDEDKVYHFQLGKKAGRQEVFSAIYDALELGDLKLKINSIEERLESLESK